MVKSQDIRNLSEQLFFIPSRRFFDAPGLICTKAREVFSGVRISIFIKIVRDFPANLAKTLKAGPMGIELDSDLPYTSYSYSLIPLFVSTIRVQQPMDCCTSEQRYAKPLDAG